MPTTKPAGYPCPKCGGHCAEYRNLADRCMRWKCNLCGIAGQIAQEAAAAAAPVAKPAHRHWRDVGRA